MDQKLWLRYPDLPDAAVWPASLTEALESGSYFFLAHKGEWVVLLSLVEGDVIQVQGNGTVQARLAINLTTGEVVHPVPGINLKRWQAEILGEVDLYERRREQQQNLPLDMSEWDFGGSERGIPKEKA